MLSVAIFAHNEEAAITEGMQAVVDAGLKPGDVVFVLVNGTTDGTMRKVEEFAARDLIRQLSIGLRAIHVRP